MDTHARRRDGGSEGGVKRKRTGSDSEGREEARRENHYMLHVGDEFDAGRYRTVSQLGKGTFGRVVEMYDATEKRSIAVKVVRAVEKYAREAKIEADIMVEVQRTLPEGQRFPIARLLRTFESRGHFCLAFDRMGPSLYHALKIARTAAEDGGGSSRGGAGSYFSLEMISHVAADCFRALAHMHAIKLTHTDLKPVRPVRPAHTPRCSPPRRTPTLRLTQRLSLSLSLSPTPRQLRRMCSSWCRPTGRARCPPASTAR